MQGADRLKTFHDVEAWDTQAEEEVGSIRDHLAKLVVFQDASGRVEPRGPFGLHFLSSVFRSLRLARIEKELQPIRESLENLADQLEATIEKTPNSPEEQRAMLKELRLVKKDLNQQKREISASMRDIRPLLDKEVPKLVPVEGSF